MGKTELHTRCKATPAYHKDCTIAPNPLQTLRVLYALGAHVHQLGSQLCPDRRKAMQAHRTTPHKTREASIRKRKLFLPSLTVLSCCKTMPKGRLPYFS